MTTITQYPDSKRYMNFEMGPNMVNYPELARIFIRWNTWKNPENDLQLLPADQREEIIIEFKKDEFGEKRVYVTKAGKTEKLFGEMKIIGELGADQNARLSIAFSEKLQQAKLYLMLRQQGKTDESCEPYIQQLKNELKSIAETIRVVGLGNFGVLRLVLNTFFENDAITEEDFNWFYSLEPKMVIQEQHLQSSGRRWLWYLQKAS